MNSVKLQQRDNVKQNQSELKDTVNEMQNTLEEINRSEDVKEWISDLENSIRKHPH